jgi:hypothetical protein
LINNRQGGRRRGRGGQRPQNLGGRPEGNRQDNRQRGNAAQLLEKYKSMARDAQLGGDRVQTEYYLQYAEHYYRMLGESRARYDEQRRARGEDMDDDENDDELAEGGDDQRLNDQQNRDDERSERNPRNDRNDGNDRFDRERSAGNRNQRPDRSDRAPRYAGNDRNDRTGGEGSDRSGIDGADSAGVDDVRQTASRPARPPRSADRGDGSEPRPNLESISFDALPPAIGRDAVSDVADVDAPAAPKRRIRKPRAAADDGDVAPAA